MAHLIPLSSTATYWGLSTGLIFLFALSLLLFPASEHSHRRQISPVVIFLPLLISISSNLYLCYPTMISAVLIAGMASILTVAALLGRQDWLPDIFLGLCLIWLVFYCFHGDYHVVGGDLLSVVEAAARNLLHGQDPYRADYSAVTPNLFFYLPLQWLPFAPAVAIGADPRLTNVVVISAMVLVTRARLHGSRSLDLAWFVFYPLIFSHLWAIGAAGSYMPPYWGLVYLFVYMLTTGKDFWAAATLGLLLASRQTSVAIAVPTLVGLVWHQPLTRSFALCATVVGVAACVLGPFVLWHHTLLYETFLLLPKEELARALANPIATREIGLMPVLRSFGFEGSSFAVQMLVGLTALALLVARHTKNRVAFTMSVAAVELAMILSGGQVFKYYFVTGLLMTSVALMFSPMAEEAPTFDRFRSGQQIDATFSTIEGAVANRRNP